jgi:hypothetical protein
MYAPNHPDLSTICVHLHFGPNRQKWPSAGDRTSFHRHGAKGVSGPVTLGTLWGAPSSSVLILIVLLIFFLASLIRVFGAIRGTI